MNDTSQFQNQMQCKCYGIVCIQNEKQMKVRNSETLISQSGFQQRTRLEQKFALTAL